MWEACPRPFEPNEEPIGRARLDERANIASWLAQPGTIGGDVDNLLTGMSAYERRAWDQILRAATVKRPHLIPDKYWEVTDRARAKVAAVADGAPDVIKEAVSRALDALQKLTTEVGMASVDASSRIEILQKRGHDVSSLEDFRQLDLSACDQILPRRKALHLVVGAVEGATTSLAITGATVSTTVSGGTTAGVAIGAVAVDATAVLAGLGRIVGEVAATYGYDVRDHEEEMYALQVLGFALAGGPAARTAALASLSRLTQDMMRRATWEQLAKHHLVSVIRKMYQQLGFTLTQKKLGQVVPIAGVVIGTGLNVALVDKTHRRAQAAYRARFLVEKYGLPLPEAWSQKATDNTGAKLSVDASALIDEVRTEGNTAPT